jgi:hypothetical protein
MASSLMSTLLRGVACRRQFMTGALCAASQIMSPGCCPARSRSATSISRAACHSVFGLIAPSRSLLCSHYETLRVVDPTNMQRSPVT